MPRLHSQRGRALVLGAALLSLSAICPAQETRGSITGKITDPQSAVIPGAPVTVTNVLTGVSNKITTNQTGYYEVNFLDPGTYSVSAEAAGFKTTVRSGISGRPGPHVLPARLFAGDAAALEDQRSARDYTRHDDRRLL
jgi:hypothetical protein